MPHAGVATTGGREASKPVYQDRQQLFNRIAPVYDQVSHCCASMASDHQSGMSKGDPSVWHGKWCAPELARQ